MYDTLSFPPCPPEGAAAAEVVVELAGVVAAAELSSSH